MNTEPRIQLIPAHALRSGDVLVVDIDPRLPPLSDEQFEAYCKALRSTTVPDDVSIITTRGVTLSVLRQEPVSSPPLPSVPTIGQEIGPRKDDDTEDTEDTEEPDTELFTEITPVTVLPSSPPNEEPVVDGSSLAPETTPSTE